MQPSYSVHSQYREPLHFAPLETVSKPNKDLSPRAPDDSVFLQLKENHSWRWISRRLQFISYSRLVAFGGDEDAEDEYIVVAASSEFRRETIPIYTELPSKFGLHNTPQYSTKLHNTPCQGVGHCTAQFCSNFGGALSLSDKVGALGGASKKGDLGNCSNQTYSIQR